MNCISQADKCEQTFLCDSALIYYLLNKRCIQLSEHVNVLLCCYILIVLHSRRGLCQEELKPYLFTREDGKWFLYIPSLWLVSSCSLCKVDASNKQTQHFSKTLSTIKYKGQFIGMPCQVWSRARAPHDQPM